MCHEKEQGIFGQYSEGQYRAFRHMVLALQYAFTHKGVFGKAIQNSRLFSKVSLPKGNTKWKMKPLTNIKFLVSFLRYLCSLLRARYSAAFIYFYGLRPSAKAKGSWPIKLVILHARKLFKSKARPVKAKLVIS